MTTVSDTSNPAAKSIIYYHRAYRKLPGINRFYFIFELLFLILFFDIIILLIYPQATYLTSHIAKRVLSFVMPPNTLEILKRPYLVGDIYIINRLGKYPGALLLLVTAIVSALTAFVAPRLKIIPKSIGIWIGFVCGIMLVSSIFFMYVPDKFPYNIGRFSELYMKTQVSIWLIIPFVLAIALTPLPSNIIVKSSITTFVLMYSLLFGCVRYIVFFYILTKHTYLFMALFFAFGPLLDFVYIVGIYSLFVSFLAVKMKGDLEKWQWLY